MKRLSIVALLLMFSVASFAQEKDKFNFGFRMGGSFANVSLPQSTKDLFVGADFKNLASPTAGFIFEIPILEYLEIRTEINFGSQGYRYVTGSVYNSIWMGYGQIPILIRGQYGSDKVRGFVQAGPQFGYGGFILTRNKDKDNDDIKNKESYSFDEAKDIPALVFPLIDPRAKGSNAFDMGIAAGAGIEFPKAGHLELEVRFYKGLSDLNDWGSEERPVGVEKLTNSSLTVSLAFKI